MTGGPIQTSRARRLVPMFATTIILAALLVDHSTFRKSPPAAEAYHQSVRAAALKMPTTFGSWLAVDMPVPVAAVKMLHPNVIVSKRFENISTHDSVSVLLVHVKDARDVLGHYPPVCYPGQGWRVQSKEEVEWVGAGRSVQGTQYKFQRDHIEAGARLVVDNFFVMRGGTICRNIDDVESVAYDRERKFFGAAQVQFVHQGRSTSERRQQIVQELLKALEPTLAAISAEGKV